MEDREPTLGDAPCWGAFTFKYRKVTIYVPSFLNNVARYSSNNFWDNLLNTYPNESYINMRYEDLKLKI
jgi:hypothetical protein